MRGRAFDSSAMDSTLTKTIPASPAPPPPCIDEFTPSGDAGLSPAQCAALASLAERVAAARCVS